MSNKYVNLCPHPVRVRRVTDGGWDFYPASSSPARAYGDVCVAGVLDNYLYYNIEPEKAIIVNVPPPQEGVMYIVSSVTKRDLPNRKDLVVPVPIKDGTGRTVGANGFFDPGLFEEGV